jgi:hypothetical protein
MKEPNHAVAYYVYDVTVLNIISIVVDLDRNKTEGPQREETPNEESETKGSGERKTTIYNEENQARKAPETKDKRDTNRQEPRQSKQKKNRPGSAHPDSTKSLDTLCAYAHLCTILVGPNYLLRGMRRLMAQHRKRNAPKSASIAQLPCSLLHAHIEFSTPAKRPPMQMKQGQLATNSIPALRLVIVASTTRVRCGCWSRSYPL